MKQKSLLISSVLIFLLALVSPVINRAAVLWDNGPFINSPGTGVGGADESLLQSYSLGMYTLGFGHQVAYDIRLADDFTITDLQGWQIDTITFYGYQTYSPTSPSPFVSVNYRIWDGPPNDPGSSVVFGDTTTNRLISSTWTGVYRVSESTTGTSTYRPIMANIVSAGFSLPPGTYWIDWQADGSLSYGPYAPPITINGQTTTGNALQYYYGWGNVLDSGTGTPQGFPFIIKGNSYRLKIIKDGLGKGTVISDPEGINCGGLCDGLFQKGSRVTLTAVPDEGSEFGGWSGDVPSGRENDNPVIVRMNSNKTITVIFNDTPPTVSISAPGDNSIVYGVTDVEAAAEDATGVTKVELFIDGVKKKEIPSWQVGVNMGASAYQPVFFPIKVNPDQKVDLEEREIVLEVDSLGEKRILQYYPECELIKPKLVNSVTLMKRFFNYLLIAGKSGSDDRLILYDVSTREEIDLLNEGIEIKQLEVFRDGLILFAGLDQQKSRFVIGMYEPEELISTKRVKTDSGIQYYYTEIASFGYQQLDQKALKNENGLFAAFSRINKNTSKSDIYLLAGKYISTLLKSGKKKVNLDYEWDTMEYPNGSCKIKIVATDTVGQQAADEITVKVQNIALTIQASIAEERAWLIKRLYGKIDLAVENPGSVPVANYVFYRRSPGQDFQIIETISESELQNGSYTCCDKFLDKSIAYTYKVLALDSDGVVMGKSNEVTVQN